MSRKGTSIIIPGSTSTGSSGITVGTTTITSGTNHGILYDANGVVGEKVLTASRIVLTDASADLASNGALTTNFVPKAASSGASLSDTTIQNASDITSISRTTNNQKLYLYATTDSDTSPTNYARLALISNAGGTEMQVLRQVGGTGSATAIDIGYAATSLIRQSGGTSILYYISGGPPFNMTATKLGMAAGVNFGWSASTDGSASLDTAHIRVAAGVSGLASGTWLQSTAGRSRVANDVTNATATMAAITGLSATLLAGRKYIGELILKCSNSTAAEGISVDFNGGTATMTLFAAGAGVLTGGTTVAVTTVSSALATALNWTTITGETWITIKFTLVCNAAGTFIPRFSEGTAHTSGTATASAGSYMLIEDCP